MPFYSIAKRLTGEVPGTPLELAKTRINDALGRIYDAADWSFQVGYAGWLCPGQVANSGSFTTTPYSTQVVANATASAALVALTAPPFITTLQYRDPARAIYNIVGYSAVGSPPVVTLTLDRPWMEPTKGPGQPYMIYQAYLVAPVQDFRRFLEVRDTTDAGRLDFWSYSQADLARLDPQRTTFADPAFVVPVGFDSRPNTSTPGWQMFELWPQQLSYVPYSFSYKRRGPQLVNQNDTAPYPITEEMIEWKAKEILLQSKAAQAEEKSKGAGAGWMIMAGAAKKEYDERLSYILPIDINLRTDNMDHVDYGNNDWGSRPYSNDLGQLNIGGYPSE